MGIADEAFELFVRDHRDKLYRLAVVLLGDRASEAEDCVQDALIRVAAKWESIDDPSAYARRAVLNSVRDSFRTLTLRRRQSEQLQIAHHPEHADVIALQLSTVTQLLQLPRGQREVLAARFLLDLSEQQAATFLGCSVGTVKSQTHKALTQLRALVQEQQS